MTDGFEFKLDTTELDEALSKLPAKFQGRIAKQALQAAGNVMLESMKALCPVATVEPDSSSNALQPGVLQESLTTQVQMSKRFPPRIKVGAPSETAHVAWWIENGFDQVKAKRHIEGKHFMSGAFDESAQRAIDVMLENLSEALNDSGQVEEEG